MLPPSTQFSSDYFTHTPWRPLCPCLPIPDQPSFPHHQCPLLWWWRREPLTIEAASSHLSSWLCPFHLFICGTWILLLHWSQNMVLRPTASALLRNLNQKCWGSFWSLVKSEEPLNESSGPQHQLRIELCGEFVKHQLQDPTPRDFD